MSWFSKLFGGGKGVVEQVSDVVDKWNPSETTRHAMSIDDIKAGDESQDSARKMELRGHATWFDVLIDGLNRLPRPIMTGWVVCILFGWISPPTHLESMSPVTQNIIWTIVTFWFGSRVLFKDIPTLIKSLRK